MSSLIEEELLRCLNEFHALLVADLTARYTFYPTFAESFLGKGCSAVAHLVQATDGQGPLRVCKHISRESLMKSGRSIELLRNELMVLTSVNHPLLNRLESLLYTEHSVFLILECKPNATDDLTAVLYSAYAERVPTRLAEVEHILSEERESHHSISAITRRVHFQNGWSEPYVVGTISDYLRSAMPPAKALVIVKQVLLALEHLHARGIAHRDVKACNVAVSFKPFAIPIHNDHGVQGVRIEEHITCQLIDFGFAKRFRNEGEGARHAEVADDLDIPMTLCGTIEYLAPETVEGVLKARATGKPSNRVPSTTKLAPAIDMFATGVLLFAMLHHKFPYTVRRGGEPHRWYHFDALCELHGKPLACSPSLPEACHELLLKLTTKHPLERITASEALRTDALRDVGNVYVFDVFADGHRIEKGTRQATVEEPVAPSAMPPEPTNAVAPAKSSFTLTQENDGGSQFSRMSHSELTS